MKEDFCNGLSEAQAERLAVLAEECGEVVAIAGKVLRHGYESCNPHTQEYNRALLEHEIADVLGVVRMMIDAADVSGDEIAEIAEGVWERKARYLHHQNFERLRERVGRALVL